MNWNNMKKVEWGVSSKIEIAERLCKECKEVWMKVPIPPQGRYNNPFCLRCTEIFNKLINII